MRAYLASPLFSKVEIENIKRVENILRDKGLDVFSPREHEDREHEVGSREWSETIFEMDRSNIDTSDVLVMIYYGNYSDSGTAWECGYAYAKNKKIIVVHTGEDSNLMVHEGSYMNVTFEELEKLDFNNLIPKKYMGKMF